MSWNSITLRLNNSSDATAFENHLLDLGAEAVTFTDGGDEPILEPELNTQPLWSETNLTALFEIDTDLYVVKTSLHNEFGETSFDVIEQGRIEDKVWEREWLSHFEPMRFGERLWICPAQQEIPEDQRSKKNVVVDMDPGVAFGTGTHETTSLCLTWLDGAKLKNKTVLDFGCGSGILAIAALKLGAKKATCIDIDIQAVEATLLNAERNHVDTKLVAYLPEDSDWPREEQYDVILANILATPLIALAQDIRRRVARGGQIVLSGILAEQEQDVRAAYEKYFNFEPSQQDGDWLCLTAARKTPAEELGDEERVTHCPNCDESFYINAAVLDSADGEVRCGECNTVFYAIDFVDTDPDEIRSNLTNPIDTGKIPKAHMVTGLWVHGKNGLEEVQHSMQSNALLQEPGGDTDNKSTTDDLIEDPEITSDDEQAALWADDLESEDIDSDGLDSGTDIEKINPAAAHLHALDDEEPIPLDQLETLQAGGAKRSYSGWIFLSFLALLLLGVQYIHQHRAQLALHSSFGQNLQNIYSQLGLELEPDWDLDAYVVNNSAVSLNPRKPEELVASFNLTNTANHAQIFPVIRLSLFNRWGERIGYRDLNPNDYLPENPKTRLEARGRVEVKVALSDPGAEALDYNVEICLQKNGVIRCQNKIY